ncbi:hypothetical protein EV178_003793 [Coemansia sp. RSA 1646]|nr:hypothetical protein EV178_003793 [Coemansia sp. RSA 1646]KAJ2086494.1 hypothetical protein IW138_005654 [Coemansia sp. RSA 986]
MAMEEYSTQTLSVLRSDPLKTVLTKKSIGEFYISKLFKDNKAPITSLDYDPTGTRCITTSADESLRIYNCAQGTRDRVSYSKKYGCSLAQFTKQPGCVAYASTKINDIVRYLSYETNQFIRYFVGHSGRVTSLQRSPDGSSTMLSAALDGTVRIWDLSTADPAATVHPVLTVNSNRCSVNDLGIAASYDPSANVIAVALASSEIQMFDVREMKRGPFKTASLVPEVLQNTERNSLASVVAGVKFVPPFGDHILVAMADGLSRIVDAFSLEHRLSLALVTPNSSTDESYIHDEGDDPLASKRMQQGYFGQQVTMTPDGKTVIAGCNNGSVTFWDISGIRDVETKSSVPLSPVGVWDGTHQDGSAIGVCAFNPHLMECFTGSSTLALWSVM